MPGSRPYDASGRRAAAEERARRVLDVAAASFAEHGWSGTTVAGVAAAAGVSDDLVHQRFGSKATLLLAALRQRAFVDSGDLAGAVAGLSLSREPDPERRLALLVGLASRSMPDIAPLVPALHQAAATDRVARQTVEEMQAQRRTTTAAAVEALLGEVPHPRVVDEVVLLTSAETYLQLAEAGWTGPDYTRWLTWVLGEALARRWA